MGNIINRVANSPLKEIDPSDYFPQKEDYQILDISCWLKEGLVLIEEDFRTFLKAFHWRDLHNKPTLVYCTTEAIIPQWAYLLIASHLLACDITSFYFGGIDQSTSWLISRKIEQIDFSYLKGCPVIIKGCAKKKEALLILSLLIKAIKPYVRSIMFGEACSAVPIYKQKNSYGNLQN